MTASIPFEMVAGEKLSPEQLSYLDGIFAGLRNRGVAFTDVAPNLYTKNAYGGEGLSATVGGEPWTFVKAGRWYTMLARVWQPHLP